MPAAHAAPAPVPFAKRRVALSVGAPAIVTTILALVAGALQVVNQLALQGHAETQAAIAVFLVFLVAIGITPATGSAFRNLIHIPDWVAVLISALIAAATAVLQIVGLPLAVHTILATVLTVLAALGFGASRVAVVPTPAKK